MKWLLPLLLLPSAAAAQTVTAAGGVSVQAPYGITEVKTEKDAAAITADIRALSDSLKRLNVTVSSISANAAASGPGLTSNNTWTGYNVFSSSAAIGPLVETATATYASLLLNACVTVASTRAFASSGDWMFTNLQASWTYKLTIEGISNTTADYWYVRFNDDSGNNYSGSNTLTDAGGTVTVVPCNPCGQIITHGLVSTGLYPDTSGHLGISLAFVQPGNNPSAFVSVYGINSSLRSNGANNLRAEGGGEWFAGQKLSSVRITNQGKSFTGRIKLQVCVDGTGF